MLQPFGRLRAARGFWPSNAQRRTITVAGPDPVATGVVGAIDRAHQRSLTGASGVIVAGEGFTPSYKATWSFAYASPALQPSVMASPNRVRDPNVALPATSGERVGVADRGWSVMDSLASIPPGVR